MHAKAKDITVDDWLRNVLDEIEKNESFENKISLEEFERDMICWQKVQSIYRNCHPKQTAALFITTKVIDELCC
jgi:hypothetical protein